MAISHPPPFFPFGGLQTDRDELSLILDNGNTSKLWLTNFRSAANLRLLKQHNIDGVVVVNYDDEKDNPHGPETGVQYCNIKNIEDDEEHAAKLRLELERAALFIQSALGRASSSSSANDETGVGAGAGGVLVHCAGGISRSSTVVIYFLMRAKQMPLRDAFALVRTKRPVIWPNIGFMAMLIEVEKELFGGGGRAPTASQPPRVSPSRRVVVAPAAKPTSKPSAKHSSSSSSVSKALGTAGGTGSFQGTILLTDYVKWTQFDAEAYAKAKKVDRGGV